MTAKWWALVALVSVLGGALGGGLCALIGEPFWQWAGLIFAAIFVSNAAGIYRHNRHRRSTR